MRNGDIPTKTAVTYISVPQNSVFIRCVRVLQSKMLRNARPESQQLLVPKMVSESEYLMVFSVIAAALLSPKHI